MEAIDLASWSEFPAAIEGIRSEYGSRTRKYPDVGEVSFPNDILFRGQADSDWPLETSLERASVSSYTVESYLSKAGACVHEIESVTSRRWTVKSRPEIEAEIAEVQDFMRVHIPHYDYLVYLRQLGFPSPLLDWTTSPYVAAFFAFEAKTNSERVAIFAFIEMPDGHKGGFGDTCIRTMGPFVTTHSRHFAQKAWYSVSTRWQAPKGPHTFCSHELVQRSSVARQDVLIKITIPRKCRKEALQQLEDFNINYYTLFHTEDSLIKTLGMRVFDLDAF